MQKETFWLTFWVTKIRGPFSTLVWKFESKSGSYILNFEFDYFKNILSEKFFSIIIDFKFKVTP